MDNMIVQTILWVAAGAVLLAYLKRRRKRKVSL
jgi:hypothetical protein